MNLMVYGKARGEHRRGHNLEFSRLRRDYVQEIALWTGKANGSIPNGDGTNGIVDMGSTIPLVPSPLGIEPLALPVHRAISCT